MLLIIEIIILFIVLPLLVFFDLIPLPKLLVLLIGFAYVIFVLYQTVKIKELLPFRFSKFKEKSKRFLTYTFISAITLVLFTALYTPETLFQFPRQQPYVWLMVMILYPFLSAYPQEVIYRVFIFERYKKILPNEVYSTILSIVAFTFLHIIYDNWIAVILSFFGAILFTISYKKTKSLTIVTIEHIILGNLVFTIGLGHYFYEAFK